MATVNNVAPLLNYINKQANGIFGAEVTDLDSFVSMGDAVISSETNTEVFTRTFFDVISKTIDMVRAYKPTEIELMTHASEYGAILRAVDVDMFASVANPAYTLENGDDISQDIVRKPAVHQMLFTGFNAWEYDVTIPDVQWKTAFKSFEDMQIVVNAVFTALANSKARDIENAGRTAYCNLIGENIVRTGAGDCVTVINLLADYNTLFGKTLTQANCIFDPEFNRYATYVISDTVKTMQKLTTLYNVVRAEKFTPRDNMRVLINSKFASACKMYLQSDVYYKDLVALPKYSEVAYWQTAGNGENNFADNTDVNIRTASGFGVYQHGVIAVIADDEAVGIMKTDERTNAHHNGRGEYTNYFAKCDMGYYNNMRNQSIVFTVAPIATATESRLNKYTATVVKTDEEAVVIKYTAKNSETVSSLKCDGVTMTAVTDYTVSTNTYTILTTFLDDLSLGDHIIEFTLSTGAVLPVTIHVVRASA